MAKTPMAMPTKCAVHKMAIFGYSYHWLLILPVDLIIDVRNVAQQLRQFDLEEFQSQPFRVYFVFVYKRKIDLIEGFILKLMPTEITRIKMYNAQHLLF